MLTIEIFPNRNRWGDEARQTIIQILRRMELDQGTVINIVDGNAMTSDGVLTTYIRVYGRQIETAVSVATAIKQKFPDVRVEAAPLLVVRPAEE